MTNTKSVFVFHYADSRLIEDIDSIKQYDFHFNIAQGVDVNVMQEISDYIHTYVSLRETQLPGIANKWFNLEGLGKFPRVQVMLVR